MFNNFVYLSIILLYRLYYMINRKYLYNYKSGGIRATEPQYMPQVAKVDKAKPKLNMNLMRDFNISDIEGLRRAYASDSGAYVHGDRMYVAGTRNLEDVWDDLKLPFGLTRYTDRYKSVKKVLDENPQVKEIQGHSLGSSIALELNKNNGWKYDTRTYNGPFVSFQPTGETGRNSIRIRDKNDWVSMFDKGAITVDRNKPNPLHAHFMSNFNDIGMKPLNIPVEVDEITEGFK